MQEQIQAPGSGPGNEEVAASVQVGVPVPQLDALLEQIDTVLNEDAQSLVHGFVQKGGE